MALQSDANAELKAVFFAEYFKVLLISVNFIKKKNEYEA